MGSIDNTALTNKPGKVRIFFGDLVHTWEKTSMWVAPLNVGLIGAYAKKMFGDEIEVKIFKDPAIMIDAINDNPPDVVALSHYVWNINLNDHVFGIAKAANPRTLTVGGGPTFTLHNSTPIVARRFFSKSKNCNSWVLDQGEIGFSRLIGTLMAADMNAPAIISEEIEGCITISHGPDVSINIGSKIEPIKDLDEIPSPYMTGLLDEFLSSGLTPIIETNRSCPYRCTFCAFGIGATKLTRYSTERVISEIDYIAEHCSSSPSLFIADANFSILPRDIQIAEHIFECHKDKGWPNNVSNYWNKARPDRVLEVAKALGGLSPVGASVQSLNGDTLQAIKRKNLPLDKITDMFGELKNFDKEMHLYSELITGLPGETKDQHLAANRTLMNLGAEVQNYNLHLIPGTEMETDAGRAEFVKETAWRLQDNAFGVYDGVPIFEGQEVVIETQTMPMDELRSLRFIHFLFQFMWGKRWYYDFLKFFDSLGIDPVDTISRIADECANDIGPIGEIYQSFRADHELENFSTDQDLFEYWAQPINLERLRKGEFGKLNYQYTFLILLEKTEPFNSFLLQVSQMLIDEYFPDKSDELKKQCAEIIDVSTKRRVSFTEDLSIIESKLLESNYDVIGWIKGGRSGPLSKNTLGTRYHYNLYLPLERLDTLKRMLTQYQSYNKNLTLRKMTEYANPVNFFYELEAVE
jgi:hypothetical protein